MFTADDALRQAKMVATDFMRAAHYEIEERYGPGHAKKHPELVATFMSVAAADFAIAAKLNEGQW